MANKQQLEILEQGVEVWNKWRKNNPNVKIDFRGADLIGKDLSKVCLNNADLRDVCFGETNLSKANLIGARLNGANFFKADLGNINLSKASLTRTNLTLTNFKDANLSEANLSGAKLVKTNLNGANLKGCNVYGIAAWDLKLKNSIQTDLVITPINQSIITVDNLELAQFIYLLLNNEKIRDVIDTITSKCVLILGNFNEQCKPVLDILREEMRKRNLLPLMFDFQTPCSRDMTETVKILAQMSKFIIADISEPRCIPHELASIVPNLAVPVQIIARTNDRPYTMISDLWKYQWIMEPLKYNSKEALESHIDKIIKDAIAKEGEIKEKRLTYTSSDWKVL